MSVDPIDNTKAKTVPKAMTLPILAVSSMTLVLALSSLVTSHRMSTLRARIENQVIEAAEHEASVREQLQKTIEATKQAHSDAKKKNERLKKKIAAVKKEMTVLKSELKASTLKTRKLKTDTKTVQSPAGLPSPSEPEDASLSISALPE